MGIEMFWTGIEFKGCNYAKSSFERFQHVFGLQCLWYLSGFSEQIYRNLTLLSRVRFHSDKN